MPYQPPIYEPFELAEEAIELAVTMGAERMREVDEAEEKAGVRYPFWVGGEEDVCRWKEGRWGQKD